MSPLEENILAPVTPEDPCGPNLEYDAAFVALERARQGKPEQQIGTTIVPAQPPEWKDVKRQAVALLARSKDLRAVCGLAEAMLVTEGLGGFAQGLSGLRGLLERHWEGLHPRLDPDDGNDSTMRMNIIGGLADPVVITALRSAPLVASRTLGRFSLKEIEMASGDVPPAAGVEAPGMATIDAVVLDCDLGDLEQTTAAARAAVEALSGIEAFLAEQVGSEQAPALGKLPLLLKKAATFLGAALARRQPLPTDGAGATGEVTNGAGASVRAFSGEISSRDDVMRALDAICRYYARHEPSSPVPILMERCQRLVSMNFIDIVRDLVPEAVTQVELLQGRPK